MQPVAIFKDVTGQSSVAAVGKTKESDLCYQW